MARIIYLLTNLKSRGPEHRAERGIGHGTGAGLLGVLVPWVPVVVALGILGAVRVPPPRRGAALLPRRVRGSGRWGWTIEWRRRND